MRVNLPSRKVKRNCQTDNQPQNTELKVLLHHPLGCDTLLPPSHPQAQEERVRDEKYRAVMRNQLDVLVIAQTISGAPRPLTREAQTLLAGRVPDSSRQVIS